MKKNILVKAGVLGMIAVIFGAFAAHALKQILTPEQLESFQTGVRYQIIHAVVLLFLFLIIERYPSKQLIIASHLIFYGVLLFSGSIYVLTLKNMFGMEILKFAGPITPIGGLLLILGWIFIVIGGVKLESKIN